MSVQHNIPLSVPRVTRTYACRHRSSGSRSSPVNIEDKSSSPDKDALDGSSPPAPSSNSSSDKHGDTLEDKYQGIVEYWRSGNKCNVCLHLMSQPHTLRDCGHSFCLACLNGVWTSKIRVQVDGRSYRSCPLCRAAIKCIPVISYTIQQNVDNLREALDLASPDSMTLLNPKWSEGDFKQTLPLPRPLPRQFPRPYPPPVIALDYAIPRLPTPFPLSP